MGLVDDDQSPPTGDAATRCAHALAVAVTALALLLGSGVGAARAADGTSGEATAAPAATTTSDTAPAEEPATTTPEPAPAEEPATTTPEPAAQVAEPTAPIALLAATPSPPEPAPPPSIAPPAQPIAADAAGAIHASFATPAELPGPTLPADLRHLRVTDFAPTVRHSIRPAPPVRERRPPRELSSVAVRATAAAPAARESTTRRAGRATAHRDAQPRAPEPPARPPRTHSADGGNSGTAPGGNGAGGGSCSSPGGLRTGGPADGPLVVLAPTPETLHADEVLRLRIERPG